MPQRTAVPNLYPLRELSTIYCVFCIIFHHISCRVIISLSPPRKRSRAIALLFLRLRGGERASRELCPAARGESSVSPPEVGCPRLMASTLTRFAVTGAFSTRQRRANFRAKREYLSLFCFCTQSGAFFVVLRRKARILLHTRFLYPLL